MLETVDNETFDWNTPQDFIVVDHNGLNRVETLDFRQQYERVQVVVGKNKFLEFREFLKFV